jgi:hypothetical protein
MKAIEVRMRIMIGTVLAVLLLAGCSEELSVEQQVIATLENMEQSAEEGKHLDFIDYVADEFSGQSGVMNRRDFHRLMLFQMNDNRRLQAQFFPIHVQEKDTDQDSIQASAQFKILITGGGGLLPEHGQLFQVETEWIRDGSDWLLSKADWEPVQLPVGSN